MINITAVRQRLKCIEVPIKKMLNTQTKILVAQVYLFSITKKTSNYSSGLMLSKVLIESYFALLVMLKYKLKHSIWVCNPDPSELDIDVDII